MTGRALLAGLTILAIAGCSPTKQVDTGRAEAEIKRSLAAQTGDRLRAVRCPDEVEANKGDRFRCVATASDGSRVRLVVTQTDGEGSVRWRLAR